MQNGAKEIISFHHGAYILNLNVGERRKFKQWMNIGKIARQIFFFGGLMESLGYGVKLYTTWEKVFIFKGGPAWERWWYVGYRVGLLGENSVAFQGLQHGAEARKPTPVEETQVNCLGNTILC